MPVSHRDIREFATPWHGEAEPTRLVEVETTLKVFRVLKGPSLPDEIRFRFYDGRGYVLVTGMPKGPSGQIGSSGIFFLRHAQGGTYRSSVDVFRPDIPTPWVRSQVTRQSCDSPKACIAAVLLTYEGSDDAESFAARLGIDATTARRLTFIGALELLTRLAAPDDHPTFVVGRACSELSGWYPLEFPPLCESVISPQNLMRVMTRAAELLEDFKEGGLAWVRSRIGSSDDHDVKGYLSLMTKSPDYQTRRLAERLLGSMH